MRFGLFRWWDYLFKADEASVVDYPGSSKSVISHKFRFVGCNLYPVRYKCLLHASAAQIIVLAVRISRI